MQVLRSDLKWIRCRDCKCCDVTPSGTTVGDVLTNYFKTKISRNVLLKDKRKRLKGTRTTPRKRTKINGGS